MSESRRTRAGEAEGAHAVVRTSFSRATRQVHLRQSLSSQSRRRQVRRDVRPARRGELLAVGPERRRLERRRLAGRLHRLVDEYPFRYGINSLLLNNRGEQVSRQRVPARHRAAAGRRARTRRGSTSTALCRRCRQLEGCKGQTGKVTVMANRWHPVVGRSRPRRRRRSRHRDERVQLAAAGAGQRSVTQPASPLAGRRPDRDDVEPEWTWRDCSRFVRRRVSSRSGMTESRATCRRASCRCTFGLDDSSAVDRVEVDWPSGRRQVLTSGLRPDTTLRITETR